MSQERVDHNTEKETIYRLTGRWSNQLAATEYRLTTLVEYPNGERRIVGEHTGDHDWAERIKAHHKIKETI